MNINTQFLNKLDNQTKSDIVNSMAKHYGITMQEALDELQGDEAEHILDYLMEPVRSATSVLMQKHGFRANMFGGN
jgi:Mg/Co/Ni transporter MgtE